MSDAPPPESIHQAQAAEVDQVVSALLNRFHGELDTQDPTVLAGASAALTRYTANAIKRAGNIPTVREIIKHLLPLINFAAEQIAADPATRESKPPKR